MAQRQQYQHCTEFEERAAPEAKGQLCELRWLEDQMYKGKTQL